MTTDLDRLRIWMTNHSYDSASLSVALGYTGDWLATIVAGRRRIGFGLQVRFMAVFGPAEFDVAFGSEVLHRGAYTNRYAVQSMAQLAAANAVRSGKFPHPKTLSCYGCSESAHLFHHESYDPSHWLDVIPLCRICHRNHHTGESASPLPHPHNNPIHHHHPLRGVKGASPGMPDLNELNQIINSIDDTKRLVIFFILITLAVLGWPFNRWIDRAAETDPLNSDASMYTVIGTAYTLIGSLFIVAIVFGWIVALVSTGVTFACFGAAGTPMIFGDMNRGRKRRIRELAKQTKPQAHYTPDFANEVIDN